MVLKTLVNALRYQAFFNSTELNCYISKSVPNVKSTKSKAIAQLCFSISDYLICNSQINSIFINIKYNVNQTQSSKNALKITFKCRQSPITGIHNDNAYSDTNYNHEFYRSHIMPHPINDEKSNLSISKVSSTSNISVTLKNSVVYKIKVSVPVIFSKPPNNEPKLEAMNVVVHSECENFKKIISRFSKEYGFKTDIISKKRNAIINYNDYEPDFLFIDQRLIQNIKGVHLTRFPQKIAVSYFKLLLPIQYYKQSNMVR